MTRSWQNTALYALIAVSLVVAFLIDAAVPPREQFVASPFALPILIAAAAVSPPRIRAVTVIALLFGAVGAYVDRSPLLPGAMNLLGLVLVGVLASLLGEQRRATGQRAREAEDARGKVVTILSSITDGFIALDPTWRIIYVNREAERFIHKVFQRESSDVLGREIWEVFASAVGTDVEREFHRVAEDRVTIVFETFLATANVWLEIHAYPNGGGLCIYFQDVTARKRAEAERDRLLARERAVAQIASALVHEVDVPAILEVIVGRSLPLVDADSATVWLVDPDRRTLTLVASGAPALASGSWPQQLAFDAPALAALAARTNQVQAVDDFHTSSPAVAISSQAAAATGAQSGLAIPLHSRGRLVGVVTYLASTPGRFSPRDEKVDATIADLFAVALENARLHDRVRAALRLREEFLAAAAHALRTPVTVIRGRAQLLLRAMAPDDRTRRYVEAIEHASGQIANLTADLVELARLRSDSAPLKRERFDLGVLAQEVVAQAAQAAAEHPINFESDAPLPVEVDRPLLRQALQRLVQNALDRSPPNSPIRVVADSRNGEAVVAVTDQAREISSERQAYVFEPLYEPIPAGKPGYTGVISLGLALARTIVEAH